jgi:hypothetical protein
VLSIISTAFSSTKASNKGSSYRSLRQRKGSRVIGANTSDNESHQDDPSGEASSLISGLGTSLALGLSGSIGSGPSAVLGIGNNPHDGGAEIYEPMANLEEFARLVVGRDWEKERKSRVISRKKPKWKGESGVSLGDLVNLAGGDRQMSPGRDSDKLETNLKESRLMARDKDLGTTAVINSVVAGSIRALWTGKVAVLTRIRQRIADDWTAKEQMKKYHSDGLASERDRQKMMYTLANPFGRHPWSDGEDDRQSSNARRSFQSTGAAKASSGDESDVFSNTHSSATAKGSSGLWGRGARVKDKLENWTG